MLGATTVIPDMESATARLRKGEMSTADWLRLREIHNAGPDYHRKFCILCAKTSCEVCYKQKNATKSDVLRVFLRLFVLMAGGLTWKDPLTYEQYCTLNRDVHRASWPHAPTAFDVFLPKEQWSRITAKRLSASVKQTLNRQFIHKTAL